MLREKRHLDCESPTGRLKEHAFGSTVFILFKGNEDYKIDFNDLHSFTVKILQVIEKCDNLDFRLNTGSHFFDSTYSEIFAI